MAYINKNVSTMAMPSGMNRMGQFPLDMSSVYYNKAELEAYAASGAIAYVGQIISLVDEVNKKVTVYSIQNTDGLLKEVGTIPLGDGSTIEVSSNGVVSLLGSANAEAGRLPMLEMVKVVDAEGEPVIDEETGLQKEEKKLVWKTLE
jgi:flagellar basal body rod protein FlgF